MNPILAMLKENNISNEQINELFQTLTQNPLAAMATICLFIIDWRVWWRIHRSALRHVAATR